MTEKTHKIAVITGDLVNSTALGREKVERAFAALEDCAKTQAEWHGAPLHFTRHRGDGWQVVLAKPEMALRSALAFRAALRAEGSEFDSYMGIAEGQIDHDIKPNLNEETSELFVRSGEALEMLKLNFKNSGLRMGYNTTQQAGTPFAQTVFADYIATSWTQTQAETMLQLLAPEKNPNFTQVAERLGKSRQAVTKSAEAAGFRQLQLVLPAMEKELKPHND